MKIKLQNPKHKNLYNSEGVYVVATQYRDCPKDTFRILEYHSNSYSAFKARDILADHDFKNGHIDNKEKCRVFKKELHEVID